MDFRIREVPSHLYPLYMFELDLETCRNKTMRDLPGRYSPVSIKTVIVNTLKDIDAQLKIKTLDEILQRGEILNF